MNCSFVYSPFLLKTQSEHQIDSGIVSVAGTLVQGLKGEKKYAEPVLKAIDEFMEI